MGDSEKDKQINLINAFCETVLNIKRDIPDINKLSKKDEEFLENYNSQFTILNSKETTVSVTITTAVKIQCDKYCKMMLLNGKNPYSFYDKDFNALYISLLKEHCKSKNYSEFPELIFSAVLELIGLEALEYENQNLQIDKLFDAKLSVVNDSFLSKINNLNNSIKKSEEKLENQDEEIKQSQKKMNESSIAILGIFSAVVLTFNGALTFTSSVLQNLSSVSVYRIVICSLIIGVVLLNVMYGLFYFIDRIINRNNQKENKSVFNLKTFLIPNIVLLILIAVVVSSWWLGIVEYRRDKFSPPQETTIYSDTMSNEEAIEIVPSNDN